jgi:hypothetical protein
MLINKNIFTLLVSSCFILSVFAQNVEADLMDKYNLYRQRLENEFVLISPSVEHYGVNIPAIDKKTDPYGNQTLTWSDGNSNFNNYIIMLVTEIELLKKYGHDYSHSLSQLLYTMMAIERLDLYSEYNLRMFWDKKIFYNGDSIKNYIKYPADINGFMLRDDVSMGFWMDNHVHFGIEFGKPNDNFTKTDKYFSVFQRGVEPMQAMSQDNVIRMLEAMAVTSHFMKNEFIGDIPIEFVNPLIPHYLSEQHILNGDSINFKRWAQDISTRLIKNMQQPDSQSAMSFKPWSALGKISHNQLFALLSTRWYMSNLVRETHVAEGSGNDFGILINAHGLGEYGENVCHRNDLHFEGSQSGLLRWLFKVAVFKNLHLPFGGSIALPSNWDDVLPRTLAAYGNVHSWNSRVFFTLRDKREDHTYEHMIMTNFLINKDDLSDVYYSGSDMWEEDSTFIADILLAAPPDGPFSDTSKQNYSVHWCTSSRVIWPADKPTARASKNYEFAGVDYLMLHNLYRLTYGGESYQLAFNPIKKKISGNLIRRKADIQTNAMFFMHAPVIIND